MGQIRLRKEIPYSTGPVWEWIKDFGNIHRIHPMIGKSYLDGDKACGVGATRVCEMKTGGFHLKEKIIDWKEGEYYTVDIYENSMPMMKRSLATFGVRKAENGKSEVYMNIEYSLKYGIIGKLMDALMMNFMMTIMMKGLFTKLEKTLAADAKTKLLTT